MGRGRAPQSTKILTPLWYSPMETRASYVIIGAFTLAVLVGVVAAVIWLAGVQFDETFAQYDIYFKGSVTGLKPGNQVRYRGVPVGIVTTMNINPDNVEEVKVRIEVPQETPIKEDAVASLEFQGITGIAYVQIEGGTQAAPPLAKKRGQDYPVIPSKASGLQELFETAPELISRFTALVDRANLLLNPQNQKRFAQTMEHVSSFTGALADSGPDLKRLLESGASTMEKMNVAVDEARTTLVKLSKSADVITVDAEAAIRKLRDLIDDMRQKLQLLTDEARTTMSEVRGLAGDLRVGTTEFIGGVSKTMRSIDREMEGVGSDARDAIKKVTEAAGQIARAADQVALFLEENREPVESFTASGLYQLTQLLSDTRVLVGALTRISAQIEQDPARFLFGSTQPGVEVK